jgi:hypothetical protein
MATLEKRIYDGDRAREVLENEAFSQAIADIKQEYTNAWMNSPTRDVEGREKLYLLLKLADKLEATLAAALTDGKMARIDLEHQAEQLARDRATGLT